MTTDTRRYAPFLRSDPCKEHDNTAISMVKVAEVNSACGIPIYGAACLILKVTKPFHTEVKCNAGNCMTGLSDTLSPLGIV